MALVTMGIRGGAGAGSDGLETQDAAYFTRLDGTYSHMLRRSRTRCALLTSLPTMCLVDSGSFARFVFDGNTTPQTLPA